MSIIRDITKTHFKLFVKGFKVFVHVLEPRGHNDQKIEFIFSSTVKLKFWKWKKGHFPRIKKWLLTDSSN